MSKPPLIARYLHRVGKAIEAGEQLRLPGGNTIERSLELLEQGEIRRATQEISPLLDASPLRDLAHFLMALIFEVDNDRELALAALAAIMSADDASYDVLCLTGDLYADWKKPDLGRKAYDRAIELAPHASHAFLRRGELKSAAGDVTAAISDLERASLLQPSLAEAHMALGNEYRDASMANAAIASYRKALAIEPDNLEIAIALDTTVASVIPPWHSAMLNDTRRNEVFDSAIRRAVKPGSHVLDIGTGTGLLAMMAARAGAAHVTACETVGAMADIAREIVALNGLSDRITIVHKHSTDLIVGEDLPRPADILITEIFDTGLLNENILETAADARARLLAPNHRIIPGSAAVFAIPIECATIASERHVSEAADFTVAPFNALTPQHYLQTELNRYDWRHLAEPAELFRFDFTHDDAENAETTVRFIPLADGTAHAVALWFSLALDKETTIATGPMDPPTHWQQAVYGVNPPIDLKQNEPVKLPARHNGRKIVVDLKA
jgi:tetratricopeptide (TPR) repeat protein